MSDAARLVWLWLSLMADPEGYVPCDLKGVALGARVDPLLARGALYELMELDADAIAGDPINHESSPLVLRVPGGYQVLSLVKDRELAKRESQRASNRRYAARARAYLGQEPENDSTLAPLPDTLPSTASPLSPEVESPIPRPKPIPKSEKEEISSPTRFEQRIAELPELTVTVLATTRVVHAIPPEFELSAELLADAKIAGVEKPEEHFARLRTGPIGGVRGVFERDLPDYIRSCFGKWRTWEQTDRAKAAQATKTVVRGPWVAAPEGPRQTGWGKHLGTHHVDFAAKHGLDANKLAGEFIRSGAIDQLKDHAEADKAFADYVKALVKAQKKGTA